MRGNLIWNGEHAALFEKDPNGKWEIRELQDPFDIRSTHLEHLDLSVRAFNCLKAAKINTVSDLLKVQTYDLLRIRLFGKKCVIEVEALLAIYGLRIGQDING